MTRDIVKTRMMAYFKYKMIKLVIKKTDSCAKYRKYYIMQTLTFIFLMVCCRLQELQFLMEIVFKRKEIG